MAMSTSDSKGAVPNISGVHEPISRLGSASDARSSWIREHEI
jgi:hypothetical protein